jgi:EpsI family protein
MAHAGRTDILHGPAHIFQGWFVAQAGFLLLFFLNHAIRRTDRRDLPPLVLRPTPAIAPERAVPRPSGQGGPLLPLCGLLLFLASLLLLKGLAGSPAPTVAAIDPASLPRTIGAWRGRSSTWITPGDFAPEPDLAILRSYENGAGDVVHVLLLRYNRQEQGHRLFSYRLGPLTEPETVVTLPAGAGGTRQVGSTPLRIGGRRLSSVHWFATLDRTDPSRRAARWRSFLDGVLRGTNPVTFFLLSSSGGDGADAGGLRAIADFHGQARDILDRQFNTPAPPHGGG